MIDNTLSSRAGESVTSATSLAPLSTTILSDATACPIQKSRMESHIQHLGVFNAAGEILSETLDDRHHGTHLYNAADLSLYSGIQVAKEPEAIYGGVFFHHYGHFLLESLARLWYAKDHPELPIVWVGVDSWPSPPQLRGWQREILELLGVGNPTRVLTAPERFPVLHVPEAGYKYADWCHPQHASFLASYDGAKQVPGRKIWLSRSNVANGVGIVNSDIIESNLLDSGWNLMCPEQLPVREQLRALAEAEEIAGEEGSAFHTLLLLKDISQKKFHVFRRHGREHMSFHTIGNVRNVNQSFYSTGRDVLVSAVGREVQRIAPNASEVMDALRVPIRRTSIRNPVGNHSVRRVRALIETLKARSYLEIGVRDGRVFNSIDCEQKVAVDTNFRFDVRQFAGSGAEFFALSPEDYATYFANDQRFDLIFINNCHHFDEVLRAITTCLPMTHAKSAFLIDNVVPVDALSAMRDGNETLRLRQAQGSDSKAWHGDVYKVAFLAKTLFPTWTLSTINSGGNPQALMLGRGLQAKYATLQESVADPSMELAHAATLSYSELSELRQQMAFTSEENAVNSVGLTK